MAQTPPPDITPTPAPAPQRGDRDTFSDRVDAFVTWLTNAVSEFSAVATNVYDNAVDAYNSATSASDSAAAASSSETSAADSATAAAESATAAANTPVGSVVAYLADTTDANKGAGMIGFNYALTYAAGTVGRWLKDLALSTGSSLMGFAQSGAGAVSSSVQTELRRSYYVNQFSTAAQAATEAAGKRLYVDAGETVTLNVPSAFATIHDAFLGTREWVIAAGGLVVIQTADGTYTPTASLRLDHPYGEYIHILGNTATPANCIISCASTDAFYLGPGFRLGKINGFRIVKTGAKANQGILTDGGAYLSIGPKIEVHNFYYGISARNGGYVNCAGSATEYVKVTNAGDVGIWAFNHSYVNCEHAEVSYSDDSANGLGGGIVAEFSSNIQANYAKTHHNWLTGFSCLSGSSIRAWSCVTTYNQMGLISGSGGQIEVFNQAGAPSPTTISNNTVYGFYCPDSRGFIYGLSGATMAGNVLGNERTGFTFAADGAMQARSGSIKIDANMPGAAAGNDTYLDLDAKANGYNIIRAMEAGAERGRLQYDHTNDRWALSAAGITSMRAYNTGKITLGRNNIATSDTAGHMQIPKASGTPTGTPSDVETGFVPIVYDSTGNKLWVYNGAWRSTTFA